MLRENLTQVYTRGAWLAGGMRRGKGTGWPWAQEQARRTRGRRGDMIITNSGIPDPHHTLPYLADNRIW